MFVQVYNIMCPVCRGATACLVDSQSFNRFFRLSIACFRHVLCIIYPTQLACGDDPRAVCFAAVSSFFSIPKVTVDRDEVLPPTACKLCVQPRPLAVNVALPAFAAERRAAAPWRFRAGAGGHRPPQIVVRPQSLTGPQIQPYS